MLHTMSKAKKNFVVTNKKELALIFAIRHFQIYFHDSLFMVEIDHILSKALQTSMDLIEQLAKWTLVIQSYDQYVLLRRN